MTDEQKETRTTWQCEQCGKVHVGGVSHKICNDCFSILSKAKEIITGQGPIAITTDGRIDLPSNNPSGVKSPINRTPEVTAIVQEAEQAQMTPAEQYFDELSEAHSFIVSKFGKDVKGTMRTFKMSEIAKEDKPQALNFLREMLEVVQALLKVIN